jgi:hypothetical protein
MTGIGMRILGHNFKSAPRPKAPASRSVADIRQQAEAEKARAAARLDRLRRITSAVGKT